MDRVCLVTEMKRTDKKLSRLIRRNEKVMLDIMKSKLSEKQKIEQYDVYWHIIGGLCAHLEEKYPYLKTESGKEGTTRIRWDKPP
jgi:hypothetical protein